MRRWYLLLALLVSVVIGTILLLMPRRTERAPTDSSVERREHALHDAQTETNSVATPAARPTLIPSTRPLSEPTLPLDAGLDAKRIDAGISKRDLFWRHYQRVQEQYDRWFDAGLGPGQVEVELVPAEGGYAVATRLTTDEEFDDEPISPDALTPWELWKENMYAASAISDMRAVLYESLTPCLRAYEARLRAQGRVLDDQERQRWKFKYVWQVQSRNGYSRIRAINVQDAWWPPDFDLQDRACYQDVFTQTLQLELPTDVHDFDYTTEITDYLPPTEES